MYIFVWVSIVCIRVAKRKETLRRSAFVVRAHNLSFCRSNLQLPTTNIVITYTVLLAQPGELFSAKRVDGDFYGLK